MMAARDSEGNARRASGRIQTGRNASATPAKNVAEITSGNFG